MCSLSVPGTKALSSAILARSGRPQSRFASPSRLRQASARAPRPKVLQGLTTWLPRLSSECALRCAQIRGLALHARVPLAANANSSARDTLARPLDEARNHCVPMRLAKSAERRARAPARPAGDTRTAPPRRNCAALYAFAAKEVEVDERANRFAHGAGRNRDGKKNFRMSDL